MTQDKDQIFFWYLFMTYNQIKDQKWYVLKWISFLAGRRKMKRKIHITLTPLTSVTGIKGSF